MFSPQTWNALSELALDCSKTATAQIGVKARKRIDELAAKGMVEADSKGAAFLVVLSRALSYVLVDFMRAGVVDEEAQRGALRAALEVFAQQPEISREIGWVSRRVRFSRFKRRIGI
jgi:hypothetical protein